MLDRPTRLVFGTGPTTPRHHLCNQPYGRFGAKFGRPTRIHLGSRRTRRDINQSRDPKMCGLDHAANFWKSHLDRQSGCF